MLQLTSFLLGFLSMLPLVGCFGTKKSSQNARHPTTSTTSNTTTNTGGLTTRSGAMEDSDEKSTTVKESDDGLASKVEKKAPTKAAPTDEAVVVNGTPVQEVPVAAAPTKEHKSTADALRTINEQTALPLSKRQLKQKQAELSTLPTTAPITKLPNTTTVAKVSPKPSVAILEHDAPKKRSREQQSFLPTQPTQATDLMKSAEKQRQTSANRRRNKLKPGEVNDYTDDTIVDAPSIKRINATAEKSQSEKTNRQTKDDEQKQP